ncbi:MAG: hypothetical protein ACREXU_16600, partial [Gammaproteobacteria bacterium]
HLTDVRRRHPTGGRGATERRVSCRSRRAAAATGSHQQDSEQRAHGEPHNPPWEADPPAGDGVGAGTGAALVAVAGTGGEWSAARLAVHGGAM